MSEITIFLLYLLAAAAFGASRMPRFENRSRTLMPAACVLVAAGIAIHGAALYSAVLPGNNISLSIGSAASMIGLELALISLVAAAEPSLRGISAGLLILGAIAALATAAGIGTVSPEHTGTSWQVRSHVLVSLLSYGLLTVGAIVAVYALVQDRRLRHGQLAASSNYLFAPLETTEKLLFGIAAAGFTGLSLAIVSGLTFVDNIFAQHLAHKSVFSILALIVFGVLLAGRYFAGWRGARAIRLYLSGFALLCLAYFGTRVILEQILARSWS